MGSEPAACPHCGSPMQDGRLRLGDGFCVFCRRHFEEVETKPPGMCWQWHSDPPCSAMLPHPETGEPTLVRWGGSGHLMRCRRPIGHPEWPHDDGQGGHDCDGRPEAPHKFAESAAYERFARGVGYEPDEWCRCNRPPTAHAYRVHLLVEIPVTKEPDHAD